MFQGMKSELTIGAREIACQQVLIEDYTVFSIQWMVFPPEHAPFLKPDFLLERYLAYIRRFTFSLIRPTVTVEGVEFRLLFSRISLIGFWPPLSREEDGRGSVTLNISRGLLVQSTECDRGELSFACEAAAGGIRVTLQLSDYCPLLLGSRKPSRWRKWLYRLTQAYIHKVVTVRFLARVYRELAGSGACVRVVKVPAERGEEI